MEKGKREWVVKERKQILFWWIERQMVKESRKKAYVNSLIGQSIHLVVIAAIFMDNNLPNMIKMK